MAPPRLTVPGVAPGAGVILALPGAPHGAPTADLPDEGAEGAHLPLGHGNTGSTRGATRPDESDVTQDLLGVEKKKRNLV